MHFNHDHDETIVVSGRQVRIRKPPGGSASSTNTLGDVQADFAQQHVLTNLKKLGHAKQKVMFILSELNFKDYLNKPFYAKATAKLPKAANLPKEDRHLGKQGDFDVLLFHRKYGLLIGEVKSVGRSEAGRADAAVTRVLTKAAQQLAKCETVARHLVSDIAPDLSVRTTLFLPYVSRVQLQRVLAANPELSQVSCQQSSNTHLSVFCVWVSVYVCLSLGLRVCVSVSWPYVSLVQLMYLY